MARAETSAGGSPGSAETVAVLGAGGTMGFGTAFRLKLAAKDAALMSDAAWQHGLSLPALDAIAGRLGQATAEHGDEDISATHLTSAPEHAH